MTHAEFSYWCGYGAEHWPSYCWGGGVWAGLQRLALIQEDHTFTFQTVEQRGHKEGVPYGPKTTKG